jgi:AraC-like DNA-binding protein
MFAAMVAKAQNWIVRAPGPVERIEACFSGRAFAPHRHDTYAIGVTLSGVQSFRYRGSARHSLPGQILVLHPDEVHDGYAGDDGSFRYRTAYLAPRDFQRVLAGRPLPFVKGGISDDPRLQAPVRALLDDCADATPPLGWDDALFDLVTALEDVCGGSRALGRTNREAAQMARDCIDARLADPPTLGELEAVTGQDRWQLSRDFRALFGTSPYRYLVLRRLDKARGLMLGGARAADAAYACGFADQSHFGRQFKQAFGMTPRAWSNCVAHDRSRPEAEPPAN